MSDRIAELERELGLYQPRGDNLSECPRCGGVAILTHQPHDGWDYLCAACSVDVLAVTDSDSVAKLWECCQARDPKPPFCMSGCTHMLKRRQATWRWQRQERAV